MLLVDFFRDLGVNDMRLTSPILSGKLASRREDLLTEENVKTIFEIQRRCTRVKGYPGVFAYDYFESKQFYGCVAGFNLASSCSTLPLVNPTVNSHVAGELISRVVHLLNEMTSEFAAK